MCLSRVRGGGGGGGSGQAWRERGKVGFSEWKGRSAPGCLTTTTRTRLHCKRDVMMVMEVGEAVVGWTDDRRVAGGVVGNGAAVVGARPADQAGPVAVRTRVVPGRSQCTTSRLKRADWRGGMGLCRLSPVPVCACRWGSRVAGVVGGDGAVVDLCYQRLPSGAALRSTVLAKKAEG